MNINADKNDRCHEKDKDRAYFVLVYDELDGCVVDYRSYLNYAQWWLWIKSVDFLIDGKAPADGYFLELLEVIVGPGQPESSRNQNKHHEKKHLRGKRYIKITILNIKRCGLKISMYNGMYTLFNNHL